MSIAVGSVAPDFTLMTKTPEGIVPVSLKEALAEGPVVLLFFPGAFTPVCTAELCDVGGGVQPLPGAKVFGISTDSVFSLEAWAKQAGIQVTLLSDYKGEVTRAYDVLWPDFAGMGPSSARAAIVIAPDGKVVYSEQTPTLLDLPNFEKIRAAL